MGFGHQLVQVPQPGLVFHQHNQMECGPPSPSAPLLPGKHPVNLCRPLHPLPTEHGRHCRQNTPTGLRVIVGPVVLEWGQAQGAGHCVQLVVGQLRAQVLGQNQGIKIQRIKFSS